MSDILEIKKRQAERREKRRLKRRRVFFSIIAILVIILLIIIIAKSCTNSGSTPANSNEVNSNEPQFVNDVVFPEVPEQTADLLSAIDKKDGIKTCYLTFDDGPTNSVTTRVLDILREYNAKATFFTVGTLLEANPDTARRLYEEGHFIANHSYSHDYSDIYANGEDFMSEINKTAEIIKKITGDDNYPMIFRFPGGGYNSGKYGEAKQSYKKLLKEKGIRYCDWNALSGDAEGGTPTKEELVSRVKKTTSGKEDVVILMHDAAAKSVAADALPDILKYLISEGYTFKTLNNAPRV